MTLRLRHDGKFTQLIAFQKAFRSGYNWSVLMGIIFVLLLLQWSNKYWIEIIQLLEAYDDVNHKKMKWNEKISKKWVKRKNIWYIMSKNWVISRIFNNNTVQKCTWSKNFMWCCYFNKINEKLKKMYHKEPKKFDINMVLLKDFTTKLKGYLFTVRIF